MQFFFYLCKSEFGIQFGFTKKKKKEVEEEDLYCFEFLKCFNTQL